ncbi:phage head closure protein [bacterium]|nr:phage head closure protein [bacterium]
MQIGFLNKRIILQQPTLVSDGMGGHSTTWTTGEITVWSAIWPVSGKEQIQSMQNVGIITHKIRIRYRSALNVSWRIKFGSRYFNIVSIVNPEERREWLDIMCKEAI